MTTSQRVGGRQITESRQQRGGARVVHHERPCVVAFGVAHGDGERGGQLVGHTHGAATRCRLCTWHVHRGGERTDL